MSGRNKAERADTPLPGEFVPIDIKDVEPGKYVRVVLNTEVEVRGGGSANPVYEGYLTGLSGDSAEDPERSVGDYPPFKISEVKEASVIE